MYIFKNWKLNLGVVVAALLYSIEEIKGCSGGGGKEPCSHCYDTITNGKCKPFSADSTKCVNLSGKQFCSYVKDSYIRPCSSSAECASSSDCPSGKICVNTGCFDKSQFPYFLSPFGGVCTEPIHTETECRSAIVEAIGGVSFRSEEDKNEMPKGCYLGHTAQTPTGIWWNKHQTGSRNNATRQICIKTADCSCSSFVGGNGFGKCEKADKKGLLCFVNEPSNCTDLADGVGKLISWEACTKISGTTTVNLKRTTTNSVHTTTVEPTISSMGTTFSGPTANAVTTTPRSTTTEKTTIE